MTYAHTQKDSKHYKEKSYASKAWSYIIIILILEISNMEYVIIDLYNSFTILLLAYMWQQGKETRQVMISPKVIKTMNGRANANLYSRAK